MVVMLFALSACYEIHGVTGNSSAEIEQEHEVYAYQGAEATQDIVQAICWQEAYSERLRYYAQLPISTIDTMEAEWHFMLHDINQDGIPELFLVVVYDNGNVDHRAVYGIVEGNVALLKTAISGEIYGGFFISPGGAPGITRIQSTGVVARYDKFELSIASFSRVATGEVMIIADSFRINAHPVTEEEFEYIFGRLDEKEWLALHEITEANISNIIFGQ